MISPRHLLLALTTAAAMAAFAAGCGSSKPAYCGDVSTLEQSVNDIDVTKGLGSLETQLQKVQSNAESLVSSAKSDFPDQTAAINTAVSRLKTDVSAITSSPAPSQLAAVASGAKSMVDAVSGFVSASKSKCS
jgi:hypothetical protein